MMGKFVFLFLAELMGQLILKGDGREIGIWWNHHHRRGDVGLNGGGFDRLPREGHCEELYVGLVAEVRKHMGADDRNWRGFGEGLETGNDFETGKGRGDIL
jgi:hypothetical protein